LADDVVRLMQAADSVKSDKSESLEKAKAARAKLKEVFASTAAKASLSYLITPALPTIEASDIANVPAKDAIAKVIEAVGMRHTEEETAAMVKPIPPADIDRATQAAERDADAFDKATKDAADLIKSFRTAIEEMTAAAQSLRTANDQTGREQRDKVGAASRKLNASFQAAAMDFDARRYRQESFYNRKAAELYEVRVRRSGVESDRHRERSYKFFYSMLAAQAGVVISSLAMARAHKSLLWLLAAAAGAAALAFSSYVYLGG
jgi:hypothetical protein